MSSIQCFGQFLLLCLPIALASEFRVVPSATCRFQYGSPEPEGCRRAHTCSMGKAALSRPEIVRPLSQREVCVVEVPSSADNPTIMIPLDYVKELHCNYDTLLQNNFQFLKVLNNGTMHNIFPKDAHSDVTVTVTFAPGSWCDLKGLGGRSDPYATSCVVTVAFPYFLGLSSYYVGRWKAVMPRLSEQGPPLIQYFITGVQHPPPCQKCFHGKACTKVPAGGGQKGTLSEISALPGHVVCLVVAGIGTADRNGFWSYTSRYDNEASRAVAMSMISDNTAPFWERVVVNLIPGVGVHGDYSQCLIISSLDEQSAGVYTFQTGNTTLIAVNVTVSRSFLQILHDNIADILIGVNGLMGIFGSLYAMEGIWMKQRNAKNATRYSQAKLQGNVQTRRADESRQPQSGLSASRRLEQQQGPANAQGPSQSQASLEPPTGDPLSASSRSTCRELSRLQSGQPQQSSHQPVGNALNATSSRNSREQMTLPSALQSPPSPPFPGSNGVTNAGSSLLPQGVPVSSLNAAVATPPAESNAPQRRAPSREGNANPVTVPPHGGAQTALLNVPGANRSTQSTPVPVTNLQPRLTVRSAFSNTNGPSQDQGSASSPPAMAATLPTQTPAPRAATNTTASGALPLQSQPDPAEEPAVPTGSNTTRSSSLKSQGSPADETEGSG